MLLSNFCNTKSLVIALKANIDSRIKFYPINERALWICDRIHVQMSNKLMAAA